MKDNVIAFESIARAPIRTGIHIPVHRQTDTKYSASVVCSRTA